MVFGHNTQSVLILRWEYLWEYLGVLGSTWEYHFSITRLNVVSGLKIDGCMHPLPQIDGCSCTRRTRTNKAPGLN